MNKQINQALQILENAGLKLGVNWQKELSELIHDISKREDISYWQVLQSPEIQEILNSDKLSTVSKRAQIKQSLFDRRHPLFTLANKEFKRLLKELKVHPKIKVMPTNFFENEKLKIEYSHNSQEELDEILADVEKINESNLVKRAVDFAQNYCR